MDSIAEKNCLQEISYLVFDENKKVSLKTISNNWEIPNKQAQEVLNKWIKDNDKKDLVKEFLVRGTDKKERSFIIIVPESTKNALEKKWKTFSCWLWSVDIKSESRKLNLPDKSEIKVKNVRINVESRDVNIRKAVPEIKKESQVKPSPFASTSSDAKKKEQASKPNPFAAQKPTEKEKVPEKPKEVKKEEVKVEKVSPQKSPEEKKKTPVEPKKSPVKGGKQSLKTKKPVAKGGINSFFNAKPAQPKKQDESKKQEEENKPEEPKEEAPKEKSPLKKEASPVASKSPKKEKDSIKRVLEDDEEIPCTPEDSTKSKKRQTKFRLKKNASNKRSRIMELEDSSDESEKEEVEEPESKLIKFDRELTPEPEQKVEVVDVEEEDVKTKDKEKETKTILKNGRVRVKAKRWVNRTYEDEDGFINTVREVEEYSASEDENENHNKPKENEKPNKKVEMKSQSAPVKKSPAPPGKTKQGSIMNFFTKK